VRLDQFESLDPVRKRCRAQRWCSDRWRVWDLHPPRVRFRTALRIVTRQIPDSRVERVAPGFVSRDAVRNTPTCGRTDDLRLKRGQPLTDSGPR
jgi:hypothetical protein